MCIDSAQGKNFDNFMADPKNNTKSLLKTLKKFSKLDVLAIVNS